MNAWAKLAAQSRGRHQALVNGLVSLIALLSVIPWSDKLKESPLWLGVIALVVLIVWRDLTSYTIPDSAVFALVLLSGADRIRQPMFAFDPTFTAVSFLLDGFAAGISVLLVRELYYFRHGHDGIGFGDVKLSVAGGALCGLYGFSLALLVSSLLGLLVALSLRCLKLGEMSGKLPFGAILAPAFFAVWIIHA